MEWYRTEYMVGGTNWLPSKVIESNVRAWVVLQRKTVFYYGTKLRKEL